MSDSSRCRDGVLVPDRGTETVILFAAGSIPSAGAAAGDEGEGDGAVVADASVLDDEQSAARP